MIETDTTMDIKEAKKIILLSFGYTPETMFRQLRVDWEHNWEFNNPDEILLLKDATPEKVYYYSNFLYDRKLGMIFGDFPSGAHFCFMEMLECMYQKKSREQSREEHEKSGNKGCWDDFQDQYIMNNRGFFLSSISDFVCKGDTFSLNSKEEFIFSKVSFRNLSDY